MMGCEILETPALSGRRDGPFRLLENWKLEVVDI